jgi:hypothetical protein
MSFDSDYGFDKMEAGGYSISTPIQQPGTGLNDILAQLKAAQAKANAANEKRYNDILGMYSNLGQAGMARIGQGEEQAQAKGTQDLTSRGLGNTTVTSSVNRGIANDAELQRQGLQENVAQLKGGVMERKTDAGPNLGLYSGLLQQMASQPRQTVGPSYSGFSSGSSGGSPSGGANAMNAANAAAYASWANGGSSYRGPGASTPGLVPAQTGGGYSGQVGNPYLSMNGQRYPAFSGQGASADTQSPDWEDAMFGGQ